MDAERKQGTGGLQRARVRAPGQRGLGPDGSPPRLLLLRSRISRRSICSSKTLDLRFVGLPVFLFSRVFSSTRQLRR